MSALGYLFAEIHQPILGQTQLSSARDTVDRLWDNKEE
jgi:hypothetical protein